MTLPAVGGRSCSSSDEADTPSLSIPTSERLQHLPEARGSVPMLRRVRPLTRLKQPAVRGEQLDLNDVQVDL